MPRINILPLDRDLMQTDSFLVDDSGGTKTALIQQLKPLLQDTIQGAVDSHLPIIYEGRTFTSPLYLDNFEFYEFLPTNSQDVEDNMYAISADTIQLGSHIGSLVLVKDAVAIGGTIVITSDNGESHFAHIGSIDETNFRITINFPFEDFTEFGINNLGSSAVFYTGTLMYDGAALTGTRFGPVSGYVAEWAEGNNTDTIPLNKIPQITADHLPNIQFGDQKVYDTVASRNDDATTQWHQGDRALVGNDTDGYEFYVYVGENQSIAGTTGDSDWAHLSMTLSFGNGSGDIATWAEGNDSNLIPASKIQAYTTIQDSLGSSVSQEDTIRFSNNFEVSSEDGYTLVEHSDVLDIGQPTGINPGEVNIQGFASTFLPHINIIGAGVVGQDVGQVVFQHYHQIEDETNTLFRIIGGAENHQVDPDDSDGYDEDGYLKFVAVESKDGSADVQVEVASFHKDKIVLNEELHITDLSGTGPYLIADADGVVSRGSINSSQFANQQALEDFITDKAEFRSDIGAGTSNLTLGNTSTTALAGDTTTITQSQADAIVANSAKNGITDAQATAIIANSAKVGITTAQADAITANTAKVGITTAQANAITANTAKVGITTAQASAIVANSAKVGITTQQASDITSNNAKLTANSTNVIASLVSATTVSDANKDSIKTNLLETSSGGDKHKYLNEMGNFDVVERIANKQNPANGIELWHGTQAEYNSETDNGTNADPNTIYFTT